MWNTPCTVLTYKQHVKGFSLCKGFIFVKISLCLPYATKQGRITLPCLLLCKCSFVLRLNKPFDLTSECHLFKDFVFNLRLTVFEGWNLLRIFTSLNSKVGLCESWKLWLCCFYFVCFVPGEEILSVFKRNKDLINGSVLHQLWEGNSLIFINHKQLNFL